MRWQWAGRTVAAIVAAFACTLLLLQVDVPGGGGRPRLACGSAFDVIAGRAGWQEWWASDLDGGGTLPRTEACPGAVNRRILAGAAVGAFALLALGATEVVARRARTETTAGGTRTTSGDLHRLGVAAEATGTVLAVAGTVGMLLVAADPDATIFLYVSRPAALLAGVLLLQPAVTLVVAGRAAVLASRRLPRRGPPA